MTSFGGGSMKITTLRSRGFRINKLSGNETMLSHVKPFMVNGKPAPLKYGDYIMRLHGWWYGDIPRDIELVA